MKLRFIIISTLILFFSFNAYAQTNVPGGDVSGTWELASSPYIIDGDIIIPDDSTLIIKPGVIVEFQGHYALTVLGRLLAIGTEMDSILFTINDTTGFSDPDTTLGGWYGIRFTDTPLNNDSSKIVHCCLEYGKAFGPVWHLNAGGAICILQFGKVLISNCLIRNNSAGSSTDHIPQGGGLYLYKSNVILRDNTFLNNRAHTGGAICFDDSNPVFLNNTIKNNFAIYGAGISMGGECFPTFTNDKFLNNIAENQGGGLLFSHPSVLKCDQITVRGNKAVWGGGIGVAGGELQANGCLITENQAELWGGGVAGDFATLHLRNCTFERNTSNWGSGGLHMDHALADINNCAFVENNAVFGGGYHALYSQITCEHNTFLRNYTEGGGAIHLEDSDCLIDQCQFEGNQALSGSGGAIECTVDSTVFGRSYRLTLSRSSMTENRAAMNSGAVRIEQTQSDFSLLDVVVDSCQFIRNHADVYASLRIGGYLEDFKVANCIFSGNTANRYAGGAGFISNSKGSVYNCVFNSNYYAYSDSTKRAQGASLGSEAEVEFVNCTFVDTSSTSGIGLSVRNGSKADITNCIFWACGYRPVSIVTGAELGCTVNINYCNIENGQDSIFISDSLSVLNWGMGNLAEDPIFVDLQNADLHLKDASPCIGTGINSFILNDKWINAPTRDIEGNTRPSPPDSEVDMGAYEHILGTPVSTGYDQIKTPGEIILYPNYPNPFKESTTFTYLLSTPCRVDLSIYNIYGQQVAILVSENQTDGLYKVEWDGSGYAAGQYFYRLETNRRVVKSGKLLMLK
jgi:predicted outer membrane repeat protein